MTRLEIVVLTCFLVSNRAVKVLFYGFYGHKRDADDGGLMMRAPFWDPGGSKALFAACDSPHYLTAEAAHYQRGNKPVVLHSVGYICEMC